MFEKLKEKIAEAKEEKRQQKIKDEEAKKDFKSRYDAFMKEFRALQEKYEIYFDIEVHASAYAVGCVSGDAKIAIKDKKSHWEEAFLEKSI